MHAPDAPSTPTMIASPRRSDMLLDLALAVGLSLLATVELTTDDRRSLVPTLLLVTLPLALRQRRPALVLALAAIGVVLSNGRAMYVDVAAVAIASFSVGEQHPDRVRSIGVVLALAAGLALSLLLERADPLLAVTLPFVIMVPGWAVGDVVRGQRQEARNRADAAARDVRERAVRLELTVAHERRHIARELHDVVAHALSVMLLQSGAARQVLDTSPGQAREALLIAEATGRDAMAELRRLLGVLAEEGEDGGMAPQPGLAQLPALVERVRDSGLAVVLEVDGERRPVPAGVDVTAYRIAQEALTNALRYARAPTIVHVAYEPGQLRLEVLDEGRSVSAEGDRSGRGLTGMAERATLVGGRLEAGPRLGGGWAVRAWLPLGVATP